MKSQDKPILLHGTLAKIAKKAGCSPDYVSRVIKGKVNTDKGKKAKRILEIAAQLNEILN